MFIPSHGKEEMEDETLQQSDFLVFLLLSMNGSMDKIIVEIEAAGQVLGELL
jgi:hypothetical protein